MTIQQADQYFAALPEGFALPQQLQAAVGGLADQVTFVGVAGTAGKTAAASLLAAMLACTQDCTAPGPGRCPPVSW